MFECCCVAAVLRCRQGFQKKNMQHQSLVLGMWCKQQLIGVLLFVLSLHKYAERLRAVAKQKVYHTFNHQQHMQHKH